MSRAGAKIRSYHLERLRIKRQRKDAPSKDSINSTLDVRRKQAEPHPTDAMHAEREKNKRLNKLLEGKITHRTKLQ